MRVLPGRTATLGTTSRKNSHSPQKATLWCERLHDGPTLQVRKWRLVQVNIYAINHRYRTLYFAQGARRCDHAAMTSHPSVRLDDSRHTRSTMLFENEADSGARSFNLIPPKAVARQSTFGGEDWTVIDDINTVPPPPPFNRLVRHAHTHTLVGLRPPTRL